MMETRCSSPYCIVVNQVRGRMFTPSDSAEGLAKLWCPECIKLGTQVQFFTGQTTEMIRGIYKSYINTELPKEVKTFLEAYTREILTQLGAEL